MALFWRIWAAVLLVNLAVLAIFVGLATLQFDEIHSELIGERLVVLGTRSAAPFEAAARIGLPLSGVRNAEALLERTRQTDDSIRAIHVFGIDGHVIHSTDRSPPEVIPSEAIAEWTAAEGAPWHVETQTDFLSGINIKTPVGMSAGGILLVYPLRENVTRVSAMGAELAVSALGVLLVVGALGGLILRLGLARQIRVFDEIDNAIAGFERDAWRSAAALSAPAAQLREGDELRSLLDAAEARYRAVGRGITDQVDRVP